MIIVLLIISAVLIIKDNGYRSNFYIISVSQKTSCRRFLYQAMQQRRKGKLNEKLLTSLLDSCMRPDVKGKNKIE